MEINFGLFANLPDLLNRLNRASLVVRKHDRDQLCVRAQPAAKVIGINQPAAIHGQKGHLSAAFLQLLAGVQYRMVLDGGGDDVIAGADEALIQQTKDGEIICFSTAASENQFG